VAAVNNHKQKSADLLHFVYYYLEASGLQERIFVCDSRFSSTSSRHFAHSPLKKLRMLIISATLKHHPELFQIPTGLVRCAPQGIPSF
jgi:hypothetical protein